MTTIIYREDEKKGSLHIEVKGTSIDIMAGLASIMKSMAENADQKPSDIAKDLYKCMLEYEKRISDDGKSK